MTKDWLMFAVVALVATSVNSAEPQSIPWNVLYSAKETGDMVHETDAQDSAPLRVKRIFELARTSAAADGNINFLGFFVGMSKYDAEELVKYYKLTESECSFNVSEENAVWYIHFSLKAVRRLTNGGNRRRTDPEALKPRIEGGRFKWSSPPAKCALSFHLAGAPGFVTLDVQTNAGNNVWISVGKDAGTTEGEINRVMEPGGRYTAVWTASESFPKMPLGIPRENPNNLPPDNIRAIVRVRP